MTKPTINLGSDWRQMMQGHAAICSRPHPGTMSAAAIDRVRRLLPRITYKDWTFRLVEQGGEGVLQLCTVVPDRKTGVPFNSNGRPLALCDAMDDGFIVDLALELVKEFELHEVAETFHLDGVDVYYPHAPNGLPVFAVDGLRGRRIPTRGIDRSG